MMFVEVKGGHFLNSVLTLAPESSPWSTHANSSPPQNSHAVVGPRTCFACVDGA